MSRANQSSTRLSLAAVQTVPVRGQVDANLEGHLSLIARAAEENVRLALFPELSLTGYEKELAHDLAFSADDTRIEPLREAASRHRMTLVVGAPIRLATGLHIASFVIHPDRASEIYTKIYLHESEEQVFDAGTLNPLIDLGDMTAAIAICADTNDPRHVERAVALDATVYLAGVFYTPEGYGPDVTKLQAYASCHSMLVVLANYGGPTGGLESAGASAIWAPGGRRLASLEPTGPGLVIATHEESTWSARTIPTGV